MDGNMTDDVIHEGIDAGKNAANGSADYVQETARKLGAQAAEVGEQVYKQAVDAGRYAAEQVKEQPWTAAIAVGLLGVALGYCLGRGSVEQPRSARDYVDAYLPKNVRRR
jgi:hypothetical protein